MRQVAGLLCLATFWFLPSARADEAALAPWRAPLAEAVAESLSWSKLQREEEASRLELENVRARFWPKLQAELVAGPVRSTPASASTAANPDWSSTAALSASLSLFENTEDLELWRQRDLEHQRALLATRIEKQKLLYDLIDKTLDLCLSLESERLSEESLRETSRQADLAERLYRQGLRRRQDSLQLRAQAERAELDRRSTRTGILKAREALRELRPSLPEDFQPSPCPKAGAPTSPPPSNARLETRLRELEDSLLRARTRSSARHWLPEARVGAEVRQGASDFYPEGGFAANQQTTTSILLSLKWTLFDAGLRRNEDRLINLRAQDALTGAEQRARQARRQVAELRDELDAYRLESSKIESLYKSDKLTYELAALEFRAGRMGYFEFLTALRDFFASEQRWLETRVRGHRLYFRHLLTQGDLDEKLGL